MLARLPPELVLETLSYLPAQSLRSLQLTCAAWNSFIRANESLIYHKAALVHRFVDSFEADLPKAKAAFARKYVEGAADWKAFCGDRFQLENNWLGRGPSTIRTVAAAGSWVHRIKIDENEGFAITTYAVGGLAVTDLREGGGVLWSLEQNYVRPYAHCEYSNGFLVFDQLGGFKEVWCLESRQPPDTYPERSPPDDRQHLAALRASYFHPNDSDRGRFRPWALLHMPTITHAFRFVYPTLLVASQNEAYLFDIPTGTLVQTIDISAPSPHGLRELSYVELSAEHVFICWKFAINIFSRRDGSLVLNIPIRDAQDIGMLLTVDTHQFPTSPGVPNAAIAPLEAVSRYYGPGAGCSVIEEFVAVHVSADGRTLAVLGNPETLLLIPDFTRIARKEVPLALSSARIDFTDHGDSLYHAFENGKIGLVMCTGIYVVTLDSTYHGVGPPMPLPESNEDYGGAENPPECGFAFPNLYICCALGFEDIRLLSQIDCLQMTDTGLYFIWEESQIPRPVTIALAEDCTDGTGEAAQADAPQIEEEEFGLEDDEDEAMINQDGQVPQLPILTFIDFAVRPSP